MVDVHIPHHILHNILIRLPLNSLLRFRCVSTHWNGLISDPYFMKSRPLRKTLIPTPSELYVLDDDANSIVELPSQFEQGNITILGTFRGIVLLFLEPYYHRTEMMILYNPFTGASKRLPNLNPPSLRYDSARIFGFGYGGNSDDLKIIIGSKPCSHYGYSCDVFSLENGSWTTFKDMFQDVIFKDDQVGVFLNGFLHWVSCNVDMIIVALDLKKMVVSMIHVPDQCSYLTSFLGTLHGHLCMIDESPSYGFDVWMMKNQGVNDKACLWSKMCSFKLDLKDDDLLGPLHTVCILEGGKIVVWLGRTVLPPVFIIGKQFSNQLIICDPSDGSYKKLKFPKNGSFQRCIEYVESMVSPSDMCFV